MKPEELAELAMLGVFVTAKLKGLDDRRQGWIIELNPLIIQGVSGAIYECEGVPVEVVNPPSFNYIFESE